jgi:hypothetical protein
LLPRIKHKVLITPELAPLFRGKEDELAKRFAILTRVLDGQGYTTDSGTHGQRGYTGDYLFAWLGCTTPLDGKVWRVMAQLGSRLFFMGVGDQEGQQDLQSMVNLLRASQGGLPYNKRVEACKTIIHRLLTALHNERGVRGVEWDDRQDPPLVQEYLMRLAVLLAFMRSGPPSENEEEAVEKESPHRAYTVLRHIARGHALVHGRTQLSDDDLSAVAQVVVSTMPRDYGRVFRALVQKKELTVAQVKAELGVKDPKTARKVMTALDRLGIVTFEQPGAGKASSIYFTSEWGWCLEGLSQELFIGQAIDNTMNNGNLGKIGGCEENNQGKKHLSQRHNFVNSINDLENSNVDPDESLESVATHPPKNPRLGEKPTKTNTQTKKPTWFTRESNPELWDKIMNMPMGDEWEDYALSQT